MNLVHCLVVAGNRHCIGSQRITIMPSALTGIAVQIAAGIAAVNEWVIRALLAFVVGGMLSLIVGFVKSEITKH
jgi:uncharacterized membrane protein